MAGPRRAERTSTSHCSPITSAPRCSAVAGVSLVHDCILEADRRFAPDARTADRAGAVNTGPLDVHPNDRSIKVGRSIRKSPPSARRW
jgi:hypothetical protein